LNNYIEINNLLFTYEKEQAILENITLNVQENAYAGYKNEVYGVGYDIGYINYTYPNDS